MMPCNVSYTYKPTSYLYPYSYFNLNFGPKSSFTTSKGKSFIVKPTSTVIDTYLKKC